MAQTKNLCAQISLDLHRKISEAREQAGQTTSEYITNLITEYFTLKENGGKTIVSGSGKSFTAKCEMVNLALSTDDDIIVIDPESEVRHEVA